MLSFRITFIEMFKHNHDSTFKKIMKIRLKFNTYSSIACEYQLLLRANLDRLHRYKNLTLVLCIQMQISSTKSCPNPLKGK